MLCASSVKKWTRFGLGWLVPVVSTPDFALLSKSRIQTSRLAWMLCVKRVFAADASAAGLRRGATRLRLRVVAGPVRSGLMPCVDCTSLLERAELCREIADLARCFFAELTHPTTAD